MICPAVCTSIFARFRLPTLQTRSGISAKPFRTFATCSLTSSSVSRTRFAKRPDFANRNAPSLGFGSGLRGGEGARRTRRLAMRGLWADAVRDRQDMAALGGCAGDVPQVAVHLHCVCRVADMTNLGAGDQTLRQIMHRKLSGFGISRLYAGLSGPGPLLPKRLPAQALLKHACFYSLWPGATLQAL